MVARPLLGAAICIVSLSLSLVFPRYIPYSPSPHVNAPTPLFCRSSICRDLSSCALVTFTILPLPLSLNPRHAHMQTQCSHCVGEGPRHARTTTIGHPDAAGLLIGTKATSPEETHQENIAERRTVSFLRRGEVTSTLWQVPFGHAPNTCRFVKNRSSQSVQALESKAQEKNSGSRPVVFEGTGFDRPSRRVTGRWVFFNNFFSVCNVTP
ncbi:hypothetical protein DAI22_03g308766 [Oryza sativa Japonica Group]|nr:hypothetical protein DAI22_03g308766 [Oryza sativa Japonica Group]